MKALFRPKSRLLQAWWMLVWFGGFQVNAGAETIVGEIIAIKDGDTVVLLRQSDSHEQSQTTIRISAIDAPEKGMPFGTQAKRALGEMCFRKQAEAVVIGTDRYGRTIAEVRCNRIEVSEEMVSRGLAWVYRKYAPESIYRRLYEAEQNARAARRGLWADAEPVYPADWRKSKH